MTLLAKLGLDTGIYSNFTNALMILKLKFVILIYLYTKRHHASRMVKIWDECC